MILMHDKIAKSTNKAIVKLIKTITMHRRNVSTQAAKPQIIGL